MRELQRLPQTASPATHELQTLRMQTLANSLPNTAQKKSATRTDADAPGAGGRGQNRRNAVKQSKTLGKHRVLSLGLLFPERSLLLPPLCLL